MAKKRSKNNKVFLTVLFLVVAIFALMVVSIPQIPVTAETNQTMLDFIGWFAGVRNHFADFVGLYAFLLALFGVGYYFLVYKPKAK